MIKNDPSFFGTPANKGVALAVRTYRIRKISPVAVLESKKTYQIARKKLFSENELADRQSLPARTIPHRVPVVEDTPQDDSVNHVDRIDNSYRVD